MGPSPQPSPVPDGVAPTFLVVGVAALFALLFVGWVALFLVDSWRTRRREKPARRLVVGFDPAVDDGGTVVLFDPEARTIAEHWKERQS